MTNRTFNLTTEPWIKVIELDTNKTIEVSLVTLFKHASQYRQLAGETKSQDLAILRLLIAILTTVYSRYNASGQPYSWYDEALVQKTTVDGDQNIEDQLLDTWQNLYQSGHFSDIVSQYLQRHANQFDFFGSQPFFQVTASDYNTAVPSNKRISTGNGTVAVKQVNRRISESAHSPAIFSPKSGALKDELPLSELVRWIISYQNFTGGTDKTKISTDEKFSVPAGWLYKLNPVFIDGQNLFEILILNLVLVDCQYKGTAVQRPVWEYDDIQDYILERKRQSIPDNISELYTTWSRILHIEWDGKQPKIFSAGLPMFEKENAFIEPMTIWRCDSKTQAYHPATKGLSSIGIAMWRKFGDYVKTACTDDIHQPGIVSWLQQLKEQDLIATDTMVTLASTALISDGNATSQSPAAEVFDKMKINASVLFDNKNADYWPDRIEGVIQVTQKIGTDYWHFAKELGELRYSDSKYSNAKPFASKMQQKFYDSLNQPFIEWLANLTNQDDRDQKIIQWKRRLRKLVFDAAGEMMKHCSARELNGVINNQKTKNVFTVTNNLKRNITIDLDLPKGK
ncbi:MAG: type I-E CRISPR-associated protein Cse1/CasA [Lactobacillus sp.]